MRVGIIDLGTNSVRFDVYEFNAQKGIRRLHREKLMVRLGEGVFTTQRLNKEAITRTTDAFRGFAKVASELRIEKMVAVATSALREALDAERLITQIERLTQIELRIISGEEEARYIARGILKNEKSQKGTFALVDIGGGSTEISLCQGRDLNHSLSLPLGVARLQQMFLPVLPAQTQGKDAINLLRAHVSEVLRKAFSSGLKIRPERILGSSGTVKALAKLHEARGWDKDVISRNRLKKLIESLTPLSREQLLAFSGMDPKRVDLILCGAVLMDEIMSFFAVAKVSVTNYSLRDGLCREQFALFRKTSRRSQGLNLEDVCQNIRRLGAPPGYVVDLVESSKMLFDRLRYVHRIPSKWREYFIAANLFRNIGKLISSANHEEHAYYIVKHADVRGFDPDSREFIGQLCLRQSGWKAGVKKLVFCRTKGEEMLFLKMLALLRIAAALEIGTSSVSALRQVKTQNNRVKLTIQASRKVSLQLLRVEQRKELFEQVFRTKLEIEAIPSV